jgi:hypothetical protein
MSSQYIYVICEEVATSSTVKIGFSADPERRLRQLQTAQSNPLVLIHKEEVPAASVRALERLIHKELRHRKARGEWFTMSPEDAIAEIKHAMIRYGDIENLAQRVRSRTA